MKGNLTSSSDTSAPIRVATYNIKHGRGMDGVLDLERTLATLKSLNADVIALQEVDDQARRSGGVDQASWLAERLGMHAAYGAFMDFQGGRYGLAILSRRPILSGIVATARRNEPGSPGHRRNRAGEGSPLSRFTLIGSRMMGFDTPGAGDPSADPDPRHPPVRLRRFQ